MQSADKVEKVDLGDVLADAAEAMRLMAHTEWGREAGKVDWLMDRIVEAEAVMVPRAHNPIRADQAAVYLTGILICYL